MDQHTLNDLKSLHRFDTWQPREPRPMDLFVKGHLFRRSLLEGWHRLTTRRIAFPGLPPCVQSFWAPQAGTGTVIGMDSYECDSAPAAREFLLRMLGDSEAALEHHRSDVAGEVSFVSSRERSAMFVRGNLVLRVYNAEEKTADVLGCVRNVDDDLVLVQDAGDVHARSAARGDKATRLEIRPEAAMPRRVCKLKVTIDAVAGDPAGYRLYSRGGNVFAEGGSLYFRRDPGDAAAQISLYEVTEEKCALAGEVDIAPEADG